jgi:hypothetical protein
LRGISCGSEMLLKCSLLVGIKAQPRQTQRRSGIHRLAADREMFSFKDFPPIQKVRAN